MGFAGRKAFSCVEGVRVSRRRRKRKGTKGELCVRNGRGSRGVLGVASKQANEGGTVLEGRRETLNRPVQCTSVIRPREELRGRSGSRASRREGRRGYAGASDGPCSPHGSTRLSIRLWNSDLDWGLVWRAGQAWICVLDCERDRRSRIVDVARSQNALRRTAHAVTCAGKALRRHILAARHVGAGV